METVALKHWFNSLSVDQAEKVKVDFAVSVDKAIKEQCLTRKDVAAKMHTSPAWVTKVLRGDVNLTIESMAKLCEAIGFALEINVAKKATTKKKLVTHSEFVTAGFARAKFRGAYEIDLGASRDAEYCNDREYADAA